MHRRLTVRPTFLLLAVAFLLSACGGFEDEAEAAFAVQGETATMTGVIGPSTPDAVRDLLAEHPELSTIVMADVPGSMDDESNLVASRLVRDAGLAVHVPADGVIASGGVDFFLAGTSRTWDEGAMFGVHSWSDGSNDGADIPRGDPSHRLYLDYYAEMGVDPDFYWFTLEAAPAASIHYMTAAELDRHGFATGSASTDTAVTTAEQTAAIGIGSLPADLEPLTGAFTKHVDVFGVHIVATPATDDAKVLHAANVMAQYLDNDADGQPDSAEVVAAMAANRATLLMAQTPDEFESLDDLDAIFDHVGMGGQDLYGDETARANGFDASLEEVHHLILNTGWSQIHPDALGQEQGSAIADAMDLARGGVFTSIPDEYPAGAWYTYDDPTCDYRCMITEYTYWAHTSLLGAQADRVGEIDHEWRLLTAEQMRTGDPTATALLTDPAYGLPTVLPDGNYTG